MSSEETSGASGESTEPGHDRLPVIFLAILLSIAIVLISATAYLSTKVTWPRTGTKAAAAESTTKSARPVMTHRISYAGLTGDQAAKLAASDFAKLLTQSGVGDTEIATNGEKLARTRCRDGGRWRPYWRVSFAGGSPLFESRWRGLLVCSRNPHVTVSGASFEH